MRILITGGTGFLGRYLAQRLVSDGHEVASTVRLKESGRRVDCGETLSLDDIRSAALCRQALSWRPELVYHLAGETIVGQKFDGSAEVLAVNAVGTANVLEAARDYGAARFVHLGTSESYGHEDRILDETQDPCPRTPYGIAKHAAEQYCWSRRGQMEVVRIRGFNTYGPGQSFNRWIPQVVRACLQNETILSTLGAQTRDYLYVDDMIDGLVRAGLTPAAATAGPVNLCSGTEISIRALNETIHRLTASRSEMIHGALPYRPIEIWRMVGSWQKAKDALGWSPKISLLEGLRRTIAFFQENHDQVEFGRRRWLE